ncbi:MAG: aldolase/citrate lyase family protein, partial [Steroidobacteraceae bacterium]|nr:aldolase/citrate lyase family protein [Steroidobacteraceae bacterium]
MEPHPPSGLRSYLFAPANHPRRAQKVFAAGADAAVLDLEDAVAVAEKTAARDAAVAALQQPRSCQGYVRINAVDTPWWRADIEACVGPWLDGLVVPKVETARSIEQVVATVAAAESRAGLLPNRIALVAVIETARGVENANEIAAADPRLRRLAFGGGDYTHDLDLVWSPEETE